MSSHMTASEVQALQASQRHDSIVRNAGIIRRQVRGMSKAERLERYELLRWGFMIPMKLAIEGSFRPFHTNTSEVGA